MIKGITSLLLVSLILSSSLCITNVSNITLGASPILSSTGNNSSFTMRKEPTNSTSGFKITDEIKDSINALVDSNRTNAAIVVGIVDPDGTQFYSHGKISNAINSTVDQNTIFAIGSNTKVFTTILLAQMVEDGLIKLNDPIDKYLPSNVIVPQYKGHKITIEDLATHTSGLPEFPSNYCPSFAISNAQTLDDKVQHLRNLIGSQRIIHLINCIKAFLTLPFQENQVQNMNIQLLAWDCLVIF